MAKTDIFLSALKLSGRRVTEQRRIICDYLANCRSHPTASRIYAELAVDHPEISRATIYNTLNALQELGALVEISFGDGHTHYETNPEPHVNLVCLRCHTIVDVPAASRLEGVVSEPWRQYGFWPTTVKTEVYGFCAECRARKKEEIRDQWREGRQSRSIQQLASQTVSRQALTEDE